jgi:hypothetical protein
MLGEWGNYRLGRILDTWSHSHVALLSICTTGYGEKAGRCIAAAAYNGGCRVEPVTAGGADARPGPLDATRSKAHRQRDWRGCGTRLPHSHVSGVRRSGPGLSGVKRSISLVAPSTSIASTDTSTFTSSPSRRLAVEYHRLARSFRPRDRPG